MTIREILVKYGQSCYRGFNDPYQIIEKLKTALRKEEVKTCVSCIHFSPSISSNEFSPLCNPSEKKYCSNYEARYE